MGGLTAKEVITLLHISRPTLYKYVKQGLITIERTINGKHRYNEDSVNRLLTLRMNNKKE